MQFSVRKLISSALLAFTGVGVQAVMAQNQARLAVYQNDAEVSKNSTVYIAMNSQNSITEPAMPDLGLAYIQKDGSCGTINWTLTINYDGDHFRTYDRRTHSYSSITAGSSDDYDRTTSPKITGQATCQRQVVPIDWSQFNDRHFYGGTLKIEWNGSDGGSDTIMLTVAGVNPDNSFVDNYLSQLAPANFPVLWYEKIISRESAAQLIHPIGHYHQFRGSTSPSTGSGTPNDQCGCPEGVGLSQIDHNDGASPIRHPTSIGNPDIFWNWAVNLQTGSDILKGGVSHGTSEWNADVAKASQHNLGLPQLASPAGCTISSQQDYINAYGMAAYNGGRYLNVVRDRTTNAYSWEFTTNHYVQDVCAATAY